MWCEWFLVKSITEQWIAERPERSTFDGRRILNYQNCRQEVANPCNGLPVHSIAAAIRERETNNFKKQLSMITQTLISWVPVISKLPAYHNSNLQDYLIEVCLTSHFVHLKYGKNYNNHFKYTETCCWPSLEQGFCVFFVGEKGGRESEKLKLWYRREEKSKQSWIFLLFCYVILNREKGITCYIGSCFLFLVMMSKALGQKPTESRLAQFPSSYGAQQQRESGSNANYFWR